MEATLSELDLYLVQELSDLIGEYTTDVPIAHGIPKQIRAHLRSTRREFNAKYNLTEKEWKRKCRRDFGAYMASTRLHGDFPTWKRYYAYLEYMFTEHAPQFTVIPPVDLSTLPQNAFNPVEAGIIPPEAHIGDVICFPDPRRQKQCMVYGPARPMLLPLPLVIPREIHLISQFPLSYYDPYLKNKLFFSLDPDELNLTLVMEYVKATDDTILPPPPSIKHRYYYVLFTHQNVNYCLYARRFTPAVLETTPYALERITNPIHDYITQYVNLTHTVHPHCVFVFNETTLKMRGLPTR